MRIDPNKGLQEYHVMLQDIARGDVNLFFASLLSDTPIPKALLEVV